ncbi:hypothetical protein [Anaerotalea alkaliphila]|uniref:Uncharacterized protein n=1 Tax=Anaerotalea alkaliphila TaxID=2662126 RepID=A0A7X5HWC3_9FIRM|nr:hypothetical protein [Anaerotalea alkaliphila]NDL67806.1 hypothetical protein [Anaerotalea alkaliphila]
MDRKVQGYGMALIGFLFLLFNALGYLLGWESRNPAFTVMGLVFVVVGLKQVRKV